MKLSAQRFAQRTGSGVDSNPGLSSGLFAEAAGAPPRQHGLPRGAALLYPREQKVGWSHQEGRRGKGLSTSLHVRGRVGQDWRMGRRGPRAARGHLSLLGVSRRVRSRGSVCGRSRRLRAPSWALTSATPPASRPATGLKGTGAPPSWFLALALHPSLEGPVITVLPGRLSSRGDGSCRQVCWEGHWNPAGQTKAY